MYWKVEGCWGPNVHGPPLHGLRRRHFEFGGADGARKGLGHDWGAPNHDKIVGARNGAHDRTNGKQKKKKIKVNKKRIFQNFEITQFYERMSGLKGRYSRAALLSPINFLFRLSFRYSFVLIGQIESL